MYSDPLKATTRHVAPNVVITSCGFSIFNKLNVGARMTLIKAGDSVVVWSAVPFGPVVEDAIRQLTGLPTTKVSHLIVPNIEHTKAAPSFKQQYPDLKIIASERVRYPDLTIDFPLKAENGNKQLEGSEIGITDSSVTDSLSFVYLPFHKNSDVAIYHKPSRTLLVADIIFNIGHDHLEQFSEETGYAADFYPHTLWSFLTRYFQPYSKVGNFIVNKRLLREGCDEGLRLIHEWDFKRIVPCHGDVIEEGAKEAFESVFGHRL